MNIIYLTSHIITHFIPLLVVRDAHLMRVADSLQVPPGSITSIAQLAPPTTTLQRTGPKLSEEEELKRLVVTLYELRGIPGLDKGTTVYNFLSFLLRSSVGRCQDKWPGLTLKYQGYAPSTNSSNLLVELLELEVKVYARSIFCLHGGHVSCQILSVCVLCIILHLTIIFILYYFRNFPKKPRRWHHTKLPGRWLAKTKLPILSMKRLMKVWFSRIVSLV